MNAVYFTDRDLGKQFPAILEQAGLNVQRHDQHFAPETPDEQWLRAVGQRGWIAITHDRRIRYKPNEIRAVETYRVALLVVVGRAPFPELARSFVATRSRIEGFIARHTPPYIAKVYRAASEGTLSESVTAGRIELWHAPDL